VGLGQDKFFKPLLAYITTMVHRRISRKSVEKPPTEPFKGELAGDRAGELAERRILEEFSKILTKEYGEKYEVKNLLDLDYGTQRLAQKLYEHLFPNKDEREPWRKILYRLKRMGNFPSDELLKKGRPHVIVILNERRVVGYSQFLTLPAGENDVVVYAEYAGLADEKFMRRNYSGRESFRGKGLYKHIFNLGHAIASAESEKKGGVVIGTIGDVEMLGQGGSIEEIKLSRNRLVVFYKLGFRAVMADMGDFLKTILMQPRLDKDSEPMLLQLMFAPMDKTKVSEETLKEVAMAYINCFYDETFDKEDVDYAKRIMEERIREARKLILVESVEKLPLVTELAKHDELLKAQIERQFGRSIDEQEEAIKTALAE